ncbi:MAG: APC family permease [Candidatus Asgardarchaeia archaeon]
MREEMERTMGLKEAIMIGIGGTVGPGIFILTGAALGIAGPGAILSHLMVVMLTIITALNYCELSTAIPMQGGGYTFTKRALGGIWSFMVGFFMFLANVVYSAFSALGFSTLISDFLRSIGIQTTNFQIILIGMVTVCLFTYINLRGGEETGKTQTLLSVSLMILLSLVLLSGILPLFNGGFYPIEDLTPYGIGSVLTTSVMIYVMYFGFEVISTASGEIKNPERTIPKSILIAVFISSFLYMFSTIVVLINVPYAYLHEMVERGETINAIAIVAIRTMGGLGFLIVSFCGFLATLTSLNAAIIASARICYALSRDGYFPDKLSYLDKETSSPRNAVILSGILSLMFTATGIAYFVVSVTDFLLLLALALINYSVIGLRKKRPFLKRPFRTPFYPILPILATFTNIVLLPVTALLHFDAFIIGSVVIVLGVLFYAYKMVGFERIKMQIGGMDIGMGFILLVMGLYLISNAILSPLINLVMAASLILIGLLTLIIGLIHVVY